MDNVENVRASRGSLPTVPESAKSRAAAEADRPSLPLERPRLSWAVDVGNSDVRAMSTFDLWRALSLGQMSGQVRVWRVGRECWTPAIEVPEIACALRVSLHEVTVATEDDAPRVTVDYVSAPPQFGISEAASCERDSQNSAAREETITPTPPPRLRTSLPEMIFDPHELSQIEAAVREREAVEPSGPVHVESPSSELPQAVVLPPRFSSVELDPERPTVLPTAKKARRAVPVWAAAAAVALFGALLAPAVVSTTGVSRRPELDNRVAAAANRAANVFTDGPQAQARIDGEATKIAPTPRPPKKVVTPKTKAQQGQKRKGRASTR